MLYLRRLLIQNSLKCTGTFKIAIYLQNCLYADSQCWIHLQTQQAEAQGFKIQGVSGQDVYFLNTYWTCTLMLSQRNVIKIQTHWMICYGHRKKIFLWHRPLMPITNLPNKLSVYSAPSTSWNKSPFGTIPLVLSADVTLVLLFIIILMSIYTIYSN